MVSPAIFSPRRAPACPVPPDRQRNRRDAQFPSSHRRTAVDNDGSLAVLFQTVNKVIAWVTLIIIFCIFLKPN